MQPSTSHDGLRYSREEKEDIMEIDKERVDEITLALLYLTRSYSVRARAPPTR